MKLLFASNNPGKLKEVTAILASPQWEIVNLNDLTSLDIEEPAETGSSFTENALLKAEWYAQASGLATFADDSGLSVDALDGQPGVHSARWIGGSDTDRNQELIRRLQGATNRSAEFTTVICYISQDQENYQFFRGVVKGSIAEELRGEAGFGYDPVFIPEGYDKTFAELGTEVKNQLSHRRQALEQFRDYLLSL